MDLFLEIVVGEPVGARFKIAKGAKVGRRNCEISIQDPKISSHHADIELRGQKFYLKDHDSSNGIKFNDLRVPELLLVPGVELKLGNTVLKVVGQDLAATAQPPSKSQSPKSQPHKAQAPSSQSPKSQAPIASTPKMPDPVAELLGETSAKLEMEAPPKSKSAHVPKSRPGGPIAPPPEIAPKPENAFEPPPPPAVERAPTWEETLLKLVENAELRAEDILTEGLAAFNPPLILKCIRGLQFGKGWLLGYGPRSVGPKALDLVLNEATAPPICFQVMPTASGADFSTRFPDVVKLNGQAVDEAALQPGDVIEILNTQLVVDFDHARN